MYRGPLNANGYGRPKIGGKLTLLHRWVVEQIEGRPLEPGEVVMHTCDNPPCFLYAHLRRATQSENLRDAVAKGRHRNGIQLGADNGGAKFTEATVVAIREAVAAGATMASTARRFHVSESQVANIVHRRHWRHVP